MSDSPTSSMGSQERLVNDIRAVIVDAEDMLLATADQSGDKIAQLRARIEARLKDARSRLASAEAILVERTRAAGAEVVEDASVTAEVSIGPRDEGGFGLGVTLHVEMGGGVSQDDADRAVATAHEVCPYSNATRGNIEVRLHVEVG